LDDLVARRTGRVRVRQFPTASDLKQHRRSRIIHHGHSTAPKEDLLVVSPEGRHFGIDIKGQSTANFWQFTHKPPNREWFLVFAYVPAQSPARCFVVPSADAMRLWCAYKASAQAREVAHSRWGINWATPHPFENRWDLLPA
jgi:hypothetical protein